MEFVIVGQYQTLAEAVLAKDFLVNEGIDAKLVDENMGDLMHLSQSFAEVKVVVKQVDAARAQELLATRGHHHSHEEEEETVEEDE